MSDIPFWMMIMLVVLILISLVVVWFTSGLMGLLFDLAFFMVMFVIGYLLARF